MRVNEMRVEAPLEWLIREVSADELGAFVRKLRLGLAVRLLSAA
jgi:hypothetical protein